MPPATNRDDQGRFQPGHSVGSETRFRPGQPTANPKGRPWGVNKWVRVLRMRRYHRAELEAVVMDEYAPPNQREAAVRLLLRLIEANTVRVFPSPELDGAIQTLRDSPTLDLSFILADPREHRHRRVAAYVLLVDRGRLRRPADMARRQA